MSKKCPFCYEAIKFDAKRVKKGVRKCPHCHEFIHPKTGFDRIRLCFEKLLASLIT